MYSDEFVKVERFLSGMFERVARSPTLGFDCLTCRELLSHADSTFRVPASTILEVVFQPESAQNRFTVPRAILSQWVQSISVTPVVFLRESADGRQSFLILHDWLLSQGSMVLVDLFRTVELQHDLFAFVGEEYVDLREAIVAELNRVCGHESALFHASTDRSLSPLPEGLFLDKVEIAAYCESQESLLRLASSSHALDSAFLAVLNDGGHSTPLIKTAEQTIENARAAKLARRASQAESVRSEFLTFAAAMRTYGRSNRLPALPAFTLPHVAAWRSFAAQYTRCTEMLGHIVESKSSSPNDTIFSAVILSALANAGDNGVANRAVDALSKIASREQDLSDYVSRRQMLLTKVEAGRTEFLDELVRHIRDNCQQEINYLHAYGWAGDIRPRLDRKIHHPTLRDLRTLAFHKAMKELYEENESRWFVRDPATAEPAYTRPTAVIIPAMPYRAATESRSKRPRTARLPFAITEALALVLINRYQWRGNQKQFAEKLRCSQAQIGWLVNRFNPQKSKKWNSRCNEEIAQWFDAWKEAEKKLRRKRSKKRIELPNHDHLATEVASSIPDLNSKDVPEPWCSMSEKVILAKLGTIFPAMMRDKQAINDLENAPLNVLQNVLFWLEAGPRKSKRR